MDHSHAGLFIAVVAFVMIAAGIMAVFNPPLPGSGAPGPTAGAVMLGGVPDVMQSQPWSCGAGSFKAVLGYYGISAFESDLIVLLNTTPSHGTYPWDMVNASQKLGLFAHWRENVTLDEIRASLEQGVPVIIDGQRYRDANRSWDDTWDTGHYMVVIGLDDRNVYLEDPAVLGSRLSVPRDTFVSLWHDYESDLPVPPGAHKYYHPGVFINGTVPANRPAYLNITDTYPAVWKDRVVQM